jgi:hypothetical protein
MENATQTLKHEIVCSFLALILGPDPDLPHTRSPDPDASAID